MATASLDTARTLDLSEGVDLLPLDASHDHGGGQHAHQGVDPLVWGDPTIVRAQARALALALGEEVDPDRLEALDQGLAGYEASLRAACGDPRVEAAHPFAYLGRFCGWEGTEPLRLEVLEPGQPSAGEHERRVLDPLEAPTSAEPYDYLALGARNIEVLRAAAPQ